MGWAAAREKLRAPIFAPLHPALDALGAAAWPGHDALTRAAAGITTARGVPLRFVKPAPADDPERRTYELRIAATGEVPTREENWHDLFNALAWIAWPRAKAMINAQHAALLEARGETEARRRGPERDALTVFDEGGIVVASSERAVLDLIAQFRWKELFWHRREELARTTRFLAFGHSLWEKALDPFLGMIAKVVYVPVDAGLLALAPAQQRASIDALLAAHFADRTRFPSAKAMPPIPVLGVPGWYSRTDEEAFYDDANYFRGPRPA